MSVKKPSTPIPVRRDEARLRDVALALPDTHEDFPWGHRALKVKGKAFVFMSADEEELSLSVKLDASHASALEQAFAQPTGYGLGKKGWVSATFGPGDAPPLALLERWIAESYALIAAPKRAKKRSKAAKSNAKSREPKAKAREATTKARKAGRRT